MVTHVRRMKPAPKELFLYLLPRFTRTAFLLSAKLPLFKEFPWYLAGGTALALQVGHRQSVDLDFFIPRIAFEELALERTLLATKKWQTSLRQKGTLYGQLAHAKMSFIAYPFFVPSRKMLQYGMVHMLLPHDIAAMKIVAISQRGRKRDFVDLYWYCTNHEPLDAVLKRAVDQFPGQEKNLNHILRSLTYFADAEEDPMPKLFFKATWKDIKKYFKHEVPKTAREVLRLK